MWNLFSGKKQEASDQSKTEYAPGTQLKYDANLISKLTQDHQELLALFTACATAYDKNNHKKLAATLGEFKRKLTAHLLLENLRFYTYMKYMLKGDSESSILLRHFQSEMGEIGKAVFAFLEKYTKDDAVYDAAFRKEFDAIGGALTTRIDAEENELYVLYTAPSN